MERVLIQQNLLHFDQWEARSLLTAHWKKKKFISYKVIDILTMVTLSTPGFQLVHRLAGDHDGKSPWYRGRLKTMPPASTGDQTLGTLTKWGFGVPRGGGATSRVGVPNRRGGVQPPRRLVGSRGKRSPRRITETVQRVPSAPLGTRTSLSPRDCRQTPRWLQDARLGFATIGGDSEGFSKVLWQEILSTDSENQNIINYKKTGSRVAWLWRDKVKGTESARLVARFWSVSWRIRSYTAFTRSFRGWTRDSRGWRTPRTSWMVLKGDDRVFLRPLRAVRDV